MLVKKEFKYCESQIEDVFQKLISNWDELTHFYNTEVKFDFDTPKDRLTYSDMADISRFIIDKKKSSKTEHFEQFFSHAEEILVEGDNDVQNLIVVGLFEGIQNIGGPEIDYYRSFDKWLKPQSLKEWQALIDFWEGEDWKTSPESERILNKPDNPT